MWRPAASSGTPRSARNGARFGSSVSSAVAPLERRHTAHEEQQPQPGSRRTASDTPASAPPAEETVDAVPPSEREHPAINTAANPAPSVPKNWRRPIAVIGCQRSTSHNFLLHSVRVWNRRDLPAPSGMLCGCIDHRGVARCPPRRRRPLQSSVQGGVRANTIRSDARRSVGSLKSTNLFKRGPVIATRNAVQRGCHAQRTRERCSVTQWGLQP